jgi:hypothetical protein
MYRNRSCRQIRRCRSATLPAVIGVAVSVLLSPCAGGPATVSDVVPMPVHQDELAVLHGAKTWATVGRVPLIAELDKWWRRCPRPDTQATPIPGHLDATG